MPSDTNQIVLTGTTVTSSGEINLDEDMVDDTNNY